MTKLTHITEQSTIDGLLLTNFIHEGRIHLRSLDKAEIWSDYILQ